jgi:hypothetical protein
MKDIIRQIAVVLTVFGSITVNILANALPINGLNTGEISDRFNVYFVPAGYVFSIWGLIYIGLIALAIYQALPAQRQNPRLRAAGWWISLGGVANAVWIFLWHYEQFPLTLAAMLVLLATLIISYIYLGIGRTQVTRGEAWAVRMPIRVYLGWISVATIANVTSLLDFLKWDRFGIAPEVWMGIMLVVVVGLSGIINFTRRDAAFTLVLLWALEGIAIKHAAVSVVAIPTWIAFGLVALILVSAYFRPRKVSNLEV